MMNTGQHLSASLQRRLCDLSLFELGDLRHAVTDEIRRRAVEEGQCHELDEIAATVADPLVAELIRHMPQPHRLAANGHGGNGHK